jgi:2-methylcitrate dehydratase PrpD
MTIPPPPAPAPRGMTVRDMLRVLAVAYEVVTRVARAFPPKVMIVHSHARYSAVGAAAASALAAGLPSGVVHAALTMAATLVNAGPRAHLISGALARNVWPAAGAWSGMTSVEWAQCGIAGARDGFADVYAGVLGSEPSPPMLTDGLGDAWAILDGYMKIYACCQHLHSLVEAALEVQPRLMARGGPAAIAAIDVEAHDLARLLPNPRPTTTLAAKFSLPHAVAATLATGTGGAAAFASSTLHDPGIAALRERVTMSPYAPALPPPNDRPARLSVRLHDGAMLEAECMSAQGGSDRPFAPDVLERKLASLVTPVYPRFAGIAAELLALDAAMLERTWERVVADFCV